MCATALAGVSLVIYVLASLGSFAASPGAVGSSGGSLSPEAAHFFKGTRCKRAFVSEDQWRVGGGTTTRCRRCGEAESEEFHSCRAALVAESRLLYGSDVDELTRGNCWAEGRSYSAAQPQVEVCGSADDLEATCVVHQAVVWADDLADKESPAKVIRRFAMQVEALLAGSGVACVAVENPVLDGLPVVPFNAADLRMPFCDQLRARGLRACEALQDEDSVCLHMVPTLLHEARGTTVYLDWKWKGRSVAALDLGKLPRDLHVNNCFLHYQYERANDWTINSRLADKLAPLVCLKSEPGPLTDSDGCFSPGKSVTITMCEYDEFGFGVAGGRAPAGWWEIWTLDADGAVKLLAYKDLKEDSSGVVFSGLVAKLGKKQRHVRLVAVHVQGGLLTRYRELANSHAAAEGPSVPEVGLDWFPEGTVTTSVFISVDALGSGNCQRNWDRVDAKRKLEQKERE